MVGDLSTNLENSIAALEEHDVGCNVDLYLYVANHESADLLYEEQVGDASSTFE